MNVSGKGKNGELFLLLGYYGFVGVRTSLVEFTSTSVILQFLNSFVSPVMLLTVTLLPWATA